LAEPLETRLLLSGHKIIAQPAVTPAIPLNNSTWTAVGPAALANGSSGRLAAVAGDPNNANVLYIAAAGGGVWKTVDAGASWIPLTDSQSTLFMGALAVAPSNPNVIYAGTGEATNSGLSFYGRGVLKSIDAGTTWTLTGNSVFNRKTISQIAVDPTNANILYVALGGGGVNGLGGNVGIFKSIDGGANWSNTTSAITTNGGYSDIQIDPTNPQHLYLALYNQSSLNGVYVTTNGGTSWSLVTGGLPGGSTLGNTKIAISPSNPQDVYVSFADPSTGGLLSMWATTNGGASWTHLTNAPNYMGGQGWYDSALIVDPHKPNVVFAAGQAGASSVIESTDGGQTWVDIHTGINGGGPHADHHAFAFDAAGHLLDGNDGGIWRLDNPTPGSIAWSDLNANLQITQFIGGTLDPSSPNSAFAGSQDNGTEQYTGSLPWTVREGGDGGLVKIDQQNSSIVYHQSPQGSFGTNNFFRKSTDGGVTWSAAISGINSADPQNFYSPFFVDPTNGSHLFFGTNHLYESTTAAASWTAIGSPGVNGWTTSTSTINAIAMAPSSPSTIYAVVGSNIFMSTTNDGVSWTVHTGPSNISQIVVDPSNPLICYVTSSAFGVAHVSKSIDGGATFTNITGNLPDLPTYSLVLNPAANTIYVGNDNGVYASTDGGTTWNPYGFGMPNVEVRDLEFNSSLGILAAITHGRGMYEISTTLGSPIVVNTTADETTPSDGFTSLREAVAQANASGGTITFDPSLTGGTISLTGGPLSIANGVVINGPSSRSLIISAASGSPLEIASGAAVTMSDFVLSGAATVLQVDSTGQAGILDVTVSGNVTDNGSLTLFQVINDTLTGSITGTGSLTKTGPQTLTLNGADSYTGGTTVTYGTLTGSTNALKGSITVNNPATLAFDQSPLAGTTGSFNGTLGGTGTIRVLGPSSTVQMGTTNGSTPSTFTNSGPTVIDAGATLAATATNDLSSTSLFIVNGTLNLGGFGQTLGALSGAATGVIYNLSIQPTLTATLIVGGSNASTEYDGLLEDVPPASGNGGKLALQKIGTATLTLVRPLATPNTYTGGTMITAGTLAGNSPALEGSITDATILNFDQSLGQITDGTFSGTITGGGALNVLSGIVRLASSSTLQNTGATTITGTLVGPASGGANAFSSQSTYTVNGSLDLGASNQTIASLNGGGNVYHFQPVGQPTLATLTLGGDNSSTVFTGVFSDTQPASGNGGTLAVTKVGSGVFTVTGASTFTGGLMVNAGMLAVGPAAVSADPMGAGTLSLNGGNLALNGKSGGTTQQIVAATGYNQDIIAEASAANAQAGTSTTFDGNFVWYEVGFPGSGTTGLPANGSTWASAFNPAVNFQLQPYTANNVAMIPGSNGSVTLTLTTPTAFSTLNFLADAANGSANLTATLHFADASTAILQLGVSDWFNGLQAAFTTGGRIIRSTTSTVTLVSGNPRLYEYDYTVPVVDQPKLLTSITFAETSGSQVGIYALSGAASSVPTSQSYPNPVQVLNVATIDVENSPTASLGNLTMAANLLTLTGTPGTSLTFGSVNMNTNSQFNTSAGTAMTLGSITSGPTTTLTKLGTGTLTLSGTDSYGATTVSAGTLVATGAGSLPNKPLSISNGAVVQLQQSSPSFVANIGSLSIPAGAKLDINNNTLFVNYGVNPDPISAIVTAITSGYNGGGWNGTPSASNAVITSSTAAAGPAATYGLGYADSADGVIAGQPANSVEIRYTVMGDTNLDRVVNSIDGIQMARNYLIAGKTAWDLGNFNYDSTINLTDAQILQKNYNLIASPTVVSTTTGTGSSTTGTSTPITPQSPTSPVTPPSTGDTTTSGGSTGLPTDPTTAKKHHRKRH
jgi:CSLREA domain-containing protein